MAQLLDSSRRNTVAWDRFEQSAKRATCRGRYEAAELRSEFIEDGHLLLGVLHTAMELPVPRPASPSRASEVLVEAVRKVRYRLLANTGRLVRPADGSIQLGQSAKQAIHSAEQEALRLHHRHVHWGHLLLALSRKGSPRVRGALVDAGLTPKVIQESLRDEPF